MKIINFVSAAMVFIFAMTGNMVGIHFMAFFYSGVVFLSLLEIATCFLEPKNFVNMIDSNGLTFSNTVNIANIVFLYLIFSGFLYITLAGFIFAWVMILSIFMMSHLFRKA